MIISADRAGTERPRARAAEDWPKPTASRRLQAYLVALRDGVIAFRRPVACAATHYHRIDKPLLDSQGAGSGLHARRTSATTRRTATT
jgi:hypothetical protein